MADDVAIVGAGPAGAWAAWRLTRLGARVTIFDGSHPREKPCGGGVTKRALDLVRPALADVSLPSVRIAAARFEVDDISADVPLAEDPGPDGGLAVFSRAAFDAALLDAAVRAGATHVSERVTDVNMTPGGVELRTAARVHRAAWLIGADGANSLVRRRLARPFARNQLSVATGYFVHGASAPEIVVRFETDPSGYIWSFPRPDHLALGICAEANGAQPGPLRARVAKWASRRGLATGARLQPYSWPIPSLRTSDWEHERATGERWVLVGDAAGLVDPLTREGIFFALQSAEFASGALAAARDGPRLYEAHLRSAIYGELSHAARLKAGFYHRPFLRLLIEALTHSARVRGVMADLIAGRQPYATLKRRLLATLEFGLAWRLLKTWRG